MNAIIGFTALIAEPGQSESQRASYSEIVMNSCNQLVDVVSDIIEISNIEAGILSYRKDVLQCELTSWPRCTSSTGSGLRKRS
jgi:signal transduction histidine kinase